MIYVIKYSRGISGETGQEKQFSSPSATGETGFFEEESGFSFFKWGNSRLAKL